MCLNDRESTTEAVIVTVPVAAILPGGAHYRVITHYVGGNPRAGHAARQHHDKSIGLVLMH